MSTFTVSAASVKGDEQKGFTIAARSDRSDIGFGDSKAQLKMILRNTVGAETHRSMHINTLEKDSEEVGDKTLIVFESPADIDGTAVLSYANILDPDDQWIFLPALKRTKRISSVNKSGPFVGSEFAFEDLTSQELNKYEYKYLRSEACDGLVCDVIERRPRYQNSGYIRQIVWVDQAIYQLRKVEFYDRRDELLKIMTIEDYRKYLDKYWRAHKFSMVNMKTKKSTDLVYNDYVLNTGLGNRDFKKSALR